MKIFNVVGARPNFMKVAPLHRAFVASGKIESFIVHTGQHFDKYMNDIFFEQLNMPHPDYYLNINGGTGTEQTAKIMMAFETILQKDKPDIVLVVGDVNSTVACSLAAAKLLIPVVHVEAGLRSGDRTMPEEINRIVTDVLSDTLFITEQSAKKNLIKEGIDIQKIIFSGNVMIDSLISVIEIAEQTKILSELALQENEYFLFTMHRPSNVDTQEGLSAIISIIKKISQLKKVVFPVHPRTLKNFENFNLLSVLKVLPQLIITEPLGYLEFLKLMKYASAVITDSGGIQEETTFLQVPCLTLRSNTERPVTVEMGTNKLIPHLDNETIYYTLTDIINDKSKKGIIPPLWDGHAAERICESILMKYVNT